MVSGETTADIAAEHTAATTLRASAPRARADGTSLNTVSPKTAAGDPSASPNKRTEASLVRFTRDEFRAVTDRARECGLPPARFIREAALGAVPKARRTPANAELIRQLARIGTALRQLAAGGRDRDDALTSDALSGALAELLDTIRRVE